jgi:HSP90 family molecular chaperone
MGLMEDSSNRTRLAKLLRYATSKSETEISLEDYVSGMQEDQKNIYYLSGESRESLLKSPAVEKLLLRKIEVIFMTDPLDEYTVQHLTEFEGKRLINAAREGLKLDEKPNEKKIHDMYREQFAPLVSFIKVYYYNETCALRSPPSQSLSNEGGNRLPPATAGGKGRLNNPPLINLIILLLS